MADKKQTIKLAVAAVALLIGVSLIAWQFLGGSEAPTESSATAPAAQADEAISKAVQESSRTLELPPELPREERKPRTVVGTP